MQIPVRNLIFSFILVFLFGVLCVFGAAYSVQKVEEKYIHKDIETVPESDVAILLGASVVKGKPSPILEARAEAAFLLYEAKKVSKILVTGDGTSLNYDEITPVHTYLREKNVPDEDILLDRTGFDTYSSMYRALHVNTIASAVIVTQEFHLPRALFIARNLGIDARGFVASGKEGLTDAYIREIPATIKAIYDVSVRRQPEAI